MILDLEILTLVFLIIILIYNYYINDCYRYFKRNKYKQYQKYNNMIRSIDNNYGYKNYYNTISDDTFKNKSNMEYPDIELEGFLDANNNTNNDTQKLPDNVLLNDRYNDHITTYTDDQLTNILAEIPSDVTDSDYSQSLVDDLQKNIIFDMDKKLSDKSKKIQKLAKDSATIASRFGRNSLLESYKNELDDYEKERTPWWAEAEYN
jgi:hypothetical protein